MAKEQNGYVLLARGVLSATAGTGQISAPARGATLTLLSTSTTNSAEGTRWKKLILSAYSSHVSAADGVLFEESIDGTNYRTLVSYTLAATTYTKYYVTVSAPILRVKYTNSANTLTAFELSLMGDPNERGQV